MQTQIVHNLIVLLIIFAAEVMIFSIPNQYVSSDGKAIVLNILGLAIGLEISLIVKETTCP